MKQGDDPRGIRRHNAGGPDQRAPFGRDRDRILYSSAFHRLAGITQVVRAGEAEYFHTRQQHTLKVAQIGRRLAEYCISIDESLAAKWGVNPEVVEAACLAHDLGHPPFGHIGEKTLNKLVEEAGDPDGFEGNAQSFRIATKIGVRFDEAPGFDLTRATMAALLKYPWLRDPSVEKKKSKWSAYKSELDDFNHAREFYLGHDRQTAEAALMDWADDIAYSVHDLEDFQRAGVLPWELIFSRRGSTQLIKQALTAWYDKPDDAEDRLAAAVERLDSYIGIYSVITKEQYQGSRVQRVALRTLTSTLIGRFLKATSLNPDPHGPPVVKGIEEEAEVHILKQITRQYVISSPTLLAQQHGQQRIIKGLFEAIHDETRRRGDIPGFVPVRLHYLWKSSGEQATRFTADCIGCLTESQTTALYSRLYGTAAGSVLDPIVL